jgi:RNA polymerase sigma factor (sigma-70 family)
MAGMGNPALGGHLDNADESLQDRELLGRLRSGEDAAFGELFSRHADAVRRLARSLADDRADAEDLSAEAFFRVLQAIRRGSGPVDNVRAYLLIVTRRVAWEWSERRRDVPVSDEVLSHRAGQNPDTSGQTHERNLITRAFTSLPERWRSVLWKVEVEGERPAVVAPNFGLSPNATAALARRARRGLRAAYLQAHLSTQHESTACRVILEKLGAYTAGTIKGAERVRVRAHLAGCSSCRGMHDELRDVCAGLRSYAGLLGPAAVVGLIAQKSGLGATINGLLSTAGAKLALAATSVAAVGVVGLVAGPLTPDSQSVDALDFHGRPNTELVITGGQDVRMTPSPVTGSLSSSVVAVGQDRPKNGAPGQGNASGNPQAAGGLPERTVPGGVVAPRDGRPVDQATKPGGQQGVVSESESTGVILIDPGTEPPTGVSDPGLSPEPPKTSEPGKSEPTPSKPGTPSDTSEPTEPSEPQPSGTTRPTATTR